MARAMDAEEDIDSLLAEIEGTLGDATPAAASRAVATQASAPPRFEPPAHVAAALARPAGGASGAQSPNPADEIDSLLRELGDELGDASLGPGSISARPSAPQLAPALAPPPSTRCRTLLGCATAGPTNAARAATSA